MAGNLTPDWRRPRTEDSPSSPPEAWTNRARSLLSWASRCLSTEREGADALRTLRIRRETAARHGLGWIPRNVSDPRPRWGLPEETDDRTGRPRSVWLPRGLLVPIRRARGLVGLHVFRADWTPGDKYPAAVFVRGGTERAFLAGSSGLPIVVVRSSLDAVLLTQEAGDLATVLALPEGTRSLSSTDLAGLAAAPFLLWTGEGTGDPALGRVCTVWPTVGGDTPSAMAAAGKSVRGWIDLGLRTARKQIADRSFFPGPSPTPSLETSPAAGAEPVGETPEAPVPVLLPKTETPAMKKNDGIAGPVAGSPPAAPEPLPEISEEELLRLSREAYGTAPQEVRDVLDSMLAADPLFHALRVDDLGGVHAVDVLSVPVPSAQVKIYGSAALESWARSLPASMGRQWQHRSEAAALAEIEERENARRDKRNVQKHSRSRVAA